MNRNVGIGVVGGLLALFGIGCGGSVGEGQGSGTVSAEAARDRGFYCGIDVTTWRPELRYYSYTNPNLGFAVECDAGCEGGPGSAKPKQVAHCVGGQSKQPLPDDYPGNGAWCGEGNFKGGVLNVLYVFEDGYMSTSPCNHLCIVNNQLDRHGHSQPDFCQADPQPVLF